MKKTVFICGMALLTAACTCPNNYTREYSPEAQYRSGQAGYTQPQQATITYRSYVQASYTRPVKQQVVYQPVMVQQRPIMVQQPARPLMQNACPCRQHRTCPCGCHS